MKKINAIKEKRIKLEILEILMDRLDDERRYTSMSYEKVGEEQKKDENGELMFNDAGEPVMKNVYDYVEIKPEDLSESASIRLNCIDSIQATLEKMI